MEHANIVVVGSLNMDLVVSADRMPRKGETLLGKAFHIVPGGKGANQAVSCAKLGANVTMLGAVGDDSFGKELKTSLRQWGVDTDNIATLDTVTGTATIVHSPDDNCIIVVPGANGEFDAGRLEAEERHIRQAAVLLVQLEINPATVERALAIARANGVTTILNPAPAAALPEHVLRMADYVTPNETEFELLCGRSFRDDADLEQLLREWEARYGGKVIVTRGEAGCSYVGENGLVHVPALPVAVRDTTGAGDAFNGALAYGITKRWPLPETISFAVAASSLSVSKFGAQAGMPTLQEVLEFASGHASQ